MSGSRVMEKPDLYGVNQQYSIGVPSRRALKTPKWTGNVTIPLSRIAMAQRDSYSLRVPGPIKG